MPQTCMGLSGSFAPPWTGAEVRSDMAAPFGWSAKVDYCAPGGWNGWKADIGDWALFGIFLDIGAVDGTPNQPECHRCKR
jgi:hypothetical protein